MTDLTDTLAERGARYGDFTDHAQIAQTLQDNVRAVPGWANLTPVKRQSLTVIMDKVARILSGDPEYRDNWHDIAGYAKLAEDRCVDTDGPQLALETDEDGWIEWSEGGKVPSPSTRVRIRLRDGTGSENVASAYDWSQADRVWDIVAYKVVD